MRNVHNFSETTKYEKRTVTHVCGAPDNRVNGPWKSSSQGKRQIARSQRSDIVRTDPLPGGKYYKSTDYLACFVTTTSYPGRVLYYGSGSYNECPLPPTKTRYAHIDEMKWDASSDWGAWNIGLTASLAPDIPLHVSAAARSIMLSKLHTNDLDAGTFLGELGETLATVRSLVKDAHNFRRGYAKLLQSMRRFGATEAAKQLVKRASRNLQGKNHFKSLKIPPRAIRREVKDWRRESSSYYLTDDYLGFRRSLGKWEYRKNRRRIRGLETKVASRYLEFIYGITPIMRDIFSVLSEFEEGPFQSPVGIAKGYMRDYDFNSENYGTSSFPLKSNIYKVTGEFKRGVECQATYKVLNPTLYQMKNYGIENPLGVAWEVTTLSFVMDWFTGIGNFISALNAGFGLHYLEGYETNFLKISGKLYHRMIPASVTPLEGSADSICGLTTTSMRRDSKPGFVPPPIYFRVDLNTSQVISSIALLITAFRR